MNIEVLQEYVDDFSDEVLGSGFKRDLDDYASSLPASQGNIVALRDIADKVLSKLDRIYAGDLPESLDSLLPSEDGMPFTAMPYNDDLRAIVEDTTIQQEEFFGSLTKLVNQLRKHVQQNNERVVAIAKFLEPYLSADRQRISSSGTATLAVVFKDKQTTGTLNEFTRTLSAWNRTLPIYHQLLRSQAPPDVELVEVQNGSIDFLVNIDVKVALDLVDLFKLGFQVFAAYLTYKQMIEPIVDSYHGNTKLIRQEAERERDMLSNIGDVVRAQIRKQHQTAKRIDPGIDATAIEVKIEHVGNVVTSHIVKGNDLKLLALPLPDAGDAPLDDAEAKRSSLREQSLVARRQLRQIAPETHQKLLEAYGNIRQQAEPEDSGEVERSVRRRSRPAAREKPNT